MATRFTLDDLRKSPAGKRNPHLVGEIPPKKSGATKLQDEKKGGITPAPGIVSMAVSIRPLSVNGAWKGQRFRSDEYKAYEQRLLAALPELTMPAPPYRIRYEFGFSNMASDWDNPCKPLQDVIGKKYCFDDKLIMEAHVRKVIVAKGSEYFTVTIESIA